MWDRIVRNMMRFWSASWIFYAIAFVLYMFSSYIAGLDRKPVEFTIVNLYGIPFWEAAPSITLMLIGLGILFHGFRLVTIDKTIITGNDADD